MICGHVRTIILQLTLFLLSLCIVNKHFFLKNCVLTITVNDIGWRASYFKHRIGSAPVKSYNHENQPLAGHAAVSELPFELAKPQLHGSHCYTSVITLFGE